MILEDLLGVLMMEGLEGAGAKVKNDVCKGVDKIGYKNLVKCQKVEFVEPD